MVSNLVRLTQINFMKIFHDQAKQYFIEDKMTDNSNILLHPVWDSLLTQVYSLLSIDSAKGIMLQGPTGTGKTTFMRILEDVILSKLRLSFTVFHSAEIVAAFKENNIDLIRKVKEFKIICIDDLGLEASSIQHYGNLIKPVSEVLLYRYQHSKATYATTNLDSQDIKEVYNDPHGRLLDRLKQMMMVVELDGPSYRK